MGGFNHATQNITSNQDTNTRVRATSDATMKTEVRPTLINAGSKFYEI